MQHHSASWLLQCLNKDDDDDLSNVPRRQQYEGVMGEGVRGGGVRRVRLEDALIKQCT